MQKSPFVFLLVALLFVFHSPGLQAEPLVKTGQTVAFMGDSITAFGAASPTGYVRLVESGLAANGIAIKVIPAGINGNKSDPMLARLQSTVLDKKPDWMTLSCGINDIWHGERGISLEDYKKNITEIVTRCEAAGVKVMILTSTPIQEIENDLNKKLAGYNDFLKQLAAEHKLPLADLNAAMWAELTTPTHARPPGNYLTVDGVHMNPFGNEVMALGVLKAFGLDEAQLTKAREVWQTAIVPVVGQAQMSLKEYEKLNATAADLKKPLNQMLDEAFQKSLQIP